MPAFAFSNETSSSRYGNGRFGSCGRSGGGTAATRANSIGIVSAGVVNAPEIPCSPAASVPR